MSDVSRSFQASWIPFLEYKRASISEVVIHGAISWVTGSQVLHEAGGKDLIFGRSLTKPFQMKGLTTELDGVLTPEAKALSVASHGSEDSHMQALRTILDSENLKYVSTPPSMPLGTAASGVTPSAFYHPCSGKHAAILKACELNGWSRDNYTSPTHPYHQVYVGELQKALGKDWNPEAMAKDGCGLPTFSMTVTELAKLYAFLAKTKSNDWIWNAMTTHPEIVGGTNRLDTAIMKACGGEVLAKEGADGLLGLSILHRDFPQGLGVVIKIAHGWDPRAMHFLASAVLRTLGFNFPNPSSLDRQKAFVAFDVVPARYASELQKIVAVDTAPSIDDTW